MQDYFSASRHSHLPAPCPRKPCRPSNGSVPRFPRSAISAALLVAADLSASRATLASAPAEYRVGPADPATGATSRAEVAADTQLWMRSGMSQVANRDGFDPNSAEFRHQMAAYQRMRNGPEFMAEVQRAQNTRSIGMARSDRGSSAE